MPGQIILMRHAETVANAEGLWQGATNGSLNGRGRLQLEKLARRFEATAPQLVVSSDLGRAEATAGALGVDFDRDPRWREADMGRWEGLTYDEIRSRDPETLDALLEGEDVALGGGERLSEVAARLREAFDEMAAKVEDEGTVVVVSHGLALLALVATLIGTRRPAPFTLMGNAAVTTFHTGDGGAQLVAYNDASHLGETIPLRNGETQLLLIRHGQTTANLDDRWQGHSDWPLTPDGIEQASQLGSFLPRCDALYASPLGRARDTAAAIAALQGGEVVFDDALKEIGFGSWENLTSEEIAAVDPEGWRVFANGEDVARGGTGETFDSVRLRMTGAVDRLVAAHTGCTIGVVSHGGATRAYLAGVLGLTYADRHRLHSLRNTAFGRFVFGERGPRVSTWNSSPHLLGIPR